MLIVGIDPSLNNTGICILRDDKIFFRTQTPPKHLSQFEKMLWQRERTNLTLKPIATPIDCVGIEQPYVRSFGAGGQGHQTANMWAIYCMLLSVCADHKLPVVMFNITQFHSLILRKKGLSKAEIIERARTEVGTRALVSDEHQADAYFVAKFACLFWKMFDEGTGAVLNYLDSHQMGIFAAEGRGIIWRPGEFWFDFRKQNPTESNLLKHGTR